jgi:hypothetical protein
VSLSFSRASLAPSIPDLVAAFLLLAVPLRGALDGQDTPAHLRVGEYILENGQIPRAELWSYTLEGQPLVLSGWLSDALFALVARLGGLEAVVLLTTCVLAAAYGLLALLLRRHGVDARISILALLFSIFLGTAGWSARPHIFSYLGTALLLWLLERRERGESWQYALLFLAWANFHAGFVYGLVLVSLYWIGAGIEAAWGDSPRWRAAARMYLHGLLVGVIATLVTPYGWRYYAQIEETLGDPRLLSRVQEYGAPDPGQPEGMVLLTALAALVALLAMVPRRLAVPVLLSTIAFLGAALIAQRHVPLFGIVVPPLLALFASEHRWRRGPGYLPGDHLRTRSHAPRSAGWPDSRSPSWPDSSIREGGRRRRSRNSIQGSCPWKRSPWLGGRGWKAGCFTTRTGVATSCTRGRRRRSTSLRCGTTWRSSTPRSR